MKFLNLKKKYLSLKSYNYFSLCVYMIDNMKVSLAIMLLFGIAFDVKSQGQYETINGKLSVEGEIMLNSGSDQVLHVRPNSGYSGYIYWVENGVAERGVLGFQAGSGDLIYRSGAHSFSHGLERFRVMANGNFGIGTHNPYSKLDVRGNISITGSQLNQDSYISQLQFINLYTTTTPMAIIGVKTKKSGSGPYDYTNITFSTSNGFNTLSEKMRISQEGNVGIGTEDTQGFKLGVNGKIAATEVKVAGYSEWSDFVFEEDYMLPSLREVENHIRRKGHLKDIPSAEEVNTEGFFLGEMDAKLLQKIEELTLYMIQLNKDMEKLKDRNQSLEEEVTKLKKAKFEKGNTQ